jgi:hypothetical protein
MTEVRLTDSVHICTPNRGAVVQNWTESWARPSAGERRANRKGLYSLCTWGYRPFAPPTARFCSRLSGRYSLWSSVHDFHRVVLQDTYHHWAT